MASNVAGLDSQEIVNQLQDMQEQMFRLKFQMSMGQMENLQKYRTLRKDRARALTELRARELKGETIPRPQTPARKGK